MPSTMGRWKPTVIPSAICLVPLCAPAIEAIAKRVWKLLSYSSFLCRLCTRVEDDQYQHLISCDLYAFGSFASLNQHYHDF
jgi:hypothetical protein